MEPAYEQGAWIGDEMRVTKHAAQYAVVEYLELAEHAWHYLVGDGQLISQNGSRHHPIDTMLRMEESGHVASSKWRVKLVELLLEKGFDPNVHVFCTDDHWGDHYCSVLHKACLRIYGECWRHSLSEYHMVRLLLQGKGDPTILNSYMYGESPIQYLDPIRPAHAAKGSVRFAWNVRPVSWPVAQLVCIILCKLVYRCSDTCAQLIGRS